MGLLVDNGTHTRGVLGPTVLAVIRAVEAFATDPSPRVKALQDWIGG